MATCLERLAASLFLVVLLGACNADDDCEGRAPCPDVGTPACGTPDVADDTGAASVDAAVYTAITDCFACHRASDLTQEKSGAALAPGAWMALAGEGLTRYDPGSPLDAELHFELRWPRRGHHPEMDAGACGDCHPVRADGLGHGVSQYGASAREQAHAAGGASCATSCHGWVGGERAIAPPYDAEALPTLVDDVSPEGLLSAIEDGPHARLWRQGFVAEAQDDEWVFQLIGPGCGGCHNARVPRHGTVPQCSDCHAFGAIGDRLHQVHLQAIGAGQAQLDPAADDRDSCAYCHNRNAPGAEDPDEVYRAACYNCHLSGHQPLNADGQPHFWVVQ